MKTNFLNVISFIAISIAIVGCGKKDAVKTEDKKDVLSSTEGSTNYEVNVANSTLGWLGTKLTGTHNGTINIANGTIWAEGEKITAGNFTIDMTSIKNLDIKEPEDNKSLVDHLSNEDFFEVNKFPTSKFEITGTEKLAQADSAGNNYKIMGNLTLKDVTKNITIAANVTMDANQFLALSKFNVDRTDFGVKFKSKKYFPDLKDKALGDIIEFDLKLEAAVKK